MKTITSVIALTAVVLLSASAVHAAGSIGKAVGSGIGGGADLGAAIGKSLDGVNFGNTLDNALPPSGAVPNIGGGVPNIGGGLPNIGGAVPNIGGGVPNIGSAVPSGNGVPNINGAVNTGIYAPGPIRNIGDSVPNNNIYDSVPASAFDNTPNTNVGIYAAPPPRTNGIYEAPNAPLNGNQTYTAAPAPNQIYGDLELRPIGRNQGGAGLADLLPSPPTGLPNLRGVNDVPTANPGFFKRNKKTILGAGGGLGLAGGGIGGYYISEDIQRGQEEGGESKVINAYDDAVETVEGWFQ